MFDMSYKDHKNTLYFQARLLVQMGAVPFLCKRNFKLKFIT